jgi:ACS family hexuronate transporter-like MFS transporter
MLQKATKNYRWIVVTLLFFATTINYIDRQVIGYLKNILEGEFNWNEKDYGYIVMAFQAMYAAGLLMFGWIVDKVGSKAGYSIAVLIWSVAAMVHGFVKSTTQFIAARMGLGIGESGNFPSAIKATTEWFPKKERAFATGIFNAGTNIGAVVVPLLVPFLLNIPGYNWHNVFIITGSLGLIWLVFWLLFYEIPAKHKKISEAEFNYIHSDKDEQDVTETGKKIPWPDLFKYRQTWCFIAGKFMTDPVWWFFLFWLPDYFHGTFNLDLKNPGWPLVVVYTVVTIGSIGGGYLSSWFIQKGWNAYKARKTTMVIAAVCVVPIITAQFTANMWVAVALLSLAAAAHQAWSANIYTTASDVFPKKTVSSVIGIGGMAGAVGGILFPLAVGNILEHFKHAGNKTAGYNLIFIICGLAYLLAWGIMHLLMPRPKMVDV